MNYVYYFTNYKDEIIYVGKTGNINQRMQTHFTRGHLPSECYESVNRIFYAETGNSKYDNEIIETILIDKHKPLYNTDKVFTENFEKTNFTLPNLKWKELFIHYNMDESVSVKFAEPIIPCFDLKKPDPERAHQLILYNTNLITHKKGMYLYYLKDILAIYEPSLLDIVKIFYSKFKPISEYSSIDEPITFTDYDSAYTAFENSNKFDQNIIQILIKTGFIFHLENDIYAVPLHTKAALQYMNNFFINTQKEKAS